MFWRCFWATGLVVSLLVADPVTATSPATSPETATVPDTESDSRSLTILIASGTRSNDPHYEFTTYSETLFAGVYDRLVDFDDDGEVVPRLATSWFQVDGTTWRFTLRPGVVFHDGSALTSADVVHSLLRPGRLPYSEIQSHLSNVRQVVALSELEVEVRLLQPDPLFLKRLCFVAIVPAESPEAILEPVGTGPYRWLRADETGVELGANPDYWDDPPLFRRAEFVFLESSDERLAWLLDGRADLAAALSAKEAIELDDRDDLWVHSRIVPGVTYLGLNAERPVLGQLDARRSIDLALDRQALAEGLFANYARPASQLAGPSSDGFDTGLAPTTRDLETARRLLEGVTEEHEPRLTLIAGIARQATAELVAEQLGEAGWQVDVRLEAFTTLFDRLSNGDFDLYLLGWSNNIADLADVHRHLVHSPDPSRGLGAFNHGRARDAELDRRIDDALRRPDAHGRSAATLAASQRLQQQALVLPLLWQMDLYGSSNRLDFTPRVDRRIDPSRIRLNQHAP